MDVITTHVNADFDCLGAMVAARKLYPDAAMAFSGSQEKTMRDFFLKSSGYLLDFTRARDIDLDLVTRLILVDCCHSSRIGRFAEIIGRPGLEIHIYDHHPESSGDIIPHGGSIRECGSTTTILAKILMDRGITVNPTEATLMMLGIYEDTGSLLFPSTTVDDYRAAAWLLEQGGNLKTVADFITQELTAEQVSLLNDLLKSLKTTSLNGADISIAHASLDHYVGDIAVLAHMIKDMENLQALFMVVSMANRIHVVARSRIPEVNAGEILKELGGGGHATAASATVRELTLIQVLQELEEILKRRVNPVRTARQIMSSPVRTMSSGATINEARDLLTRYNVNAMPVMDGRTMIGIISRRIVEQALYHGLGDVPVNDYMHTEFFRATLDTPLAMIQDYFIGRHRRFVPVFDGEDLAGAVTRTDLLRSMLAGEALYDLGRETIPFKSREVEGLLRKQLSPRVNGILKDLGEEAERLDISIYAVGGFVRDLLLNIPNYDIDITVEGDGILFAESFAARNGCRSKSHSKFGTAVLIYPDGFKIDVASTRTEYYASPGALPTVERSSLKSDLYRRDFTINTLAICLNRSRFGLLVDYYGAQRDIHDRVIRVLHNLSFVEDPTRVFRAIRFEHRLGFRIASHTENLIKNAVKKDFLQRLGGKRLLSELVQILREKEPVRAVERMENLGLLRFIHPNIRYNHGMRRLLEETEQVVNWFRLLFLDQHLEKWVVHFLAMCDQLSMDDFTETCSRLSVNEHYRERLCEARQMGSQVLDGLQKRMSREPAPEPGDLYFTLQGLPTEMLLYVMAKTGNDEVRKGISLYITQLQKIHTILTGDDLLQLGVPQGPKIGRVLQELLRAKLNGRAETREDEVALVARLAADCAPLLTASG